MSEQTDIETKCRCGKSIAMGTDGQWRHIKMTFDCSYAKPNESQETSLIPEDLKSTYEYIERRNQMPFATTPYWERHARLIERVGRAEAALRSIADGQTFSPMRTAREALLPLSAVKF